MNSKNIYKEGDRSSAICHNCKGIVSTTFKYSFVTVKICGIDRKVTGILQGFCDLCNKPVSIPHQESIKIGNVMKKSAEGKDLNKDCSNYDENKYRNPAVTVDIAIIYPVPDVDEEKILLIKRKHHPFRNCRAIPGGFVEIDKKETLEEAAYRELQEETSLSKRELKKSELRQFRTYGDPGRDPRTRVISVLFYAVVPYSEKLLKSVKARDDAKDAGWFSLNKLPKYMAFDHKKILEELREDDFLQFCVNSVRNSRGK